MQPMNSHNFSYSMNINEWSTVIVISSFSRREKQERQESEEGRNGEPNAKEEDGQQDKEEDKQQDKQDSSID